VDGAVLAVRREAFAAVGGFDEDFFFYSDESDLCARLQKAGWRVRFLPSAEVIHVRGASVAKEDQAERFLRRMVNSQFLLASKHLPPWKVRVYARLQIGHFVRLSLTHRLLRRFGHFTDSRKIWMLDAYSRIWKEVAECPSAAPTLATDARSSKAKEPVKAD
jgi:GT2 family glycosyltransferase